MIEWQAAQVPWPVSSTSCWRAVFVTSGAGRLAFTLSGGGDGGAHAIWDRMNLPRSTWEGSPPCAKFAAMLPWVRNPARCPAGIVVATKLVLVTPLTP